jgi:pyruvate-formate lyase-activating enzyme
MWITLSYNGDNNGVTFSPIYPVMFKGALEKLGFNVELVANPDCYDYEGLPSDNILHPSYQHLIKFIENYTGEALSLAELPIDFDNMPDTDIMGTTTAFGCKNHCKYCPSKTMQFTIRDREMVEMEIQQITSKRKYFEFFDNNVLMNPDFLNIIKVVPKGVTWGALINVDTSDVVTDEILASMYKHGCRNLYIGVETFEEKDLEFFGKPYVHKVKPKDFITRLNDLGFNVYAFLIRGLPYEDEESFSSMLDWLDGNNVKYSINRFTIDGDPITSTPFQSYFHLKRMEILDRQLSRYNINVFLENYKNI